MPTCPRCGADVTAVRLDEATDHVEGSPSGWDPSVIAWRCDNDHVLAEGDVVD